METRMGINWRDGERNSKTVHAHGLRSQNPALILITLLLSAPIYETHWQKYAPLCLSVNHSKLLSTLIAS